MVNGQTVSIDPLNLLAVDAHANRSKGDGDTATCRPTSPSVAPTSQDRLP
jgi:hypothetical protein